MKINPFSPPEMMESDSQFAKRPQGKQRNRNEQMAIAFLAANALILLVAVIAGVYSFLRYY